MIVTELYKGQGLGNQLACYVATRVIALDKGYAFGIEHPERFKGADFLSLDFGLPVHGGKSREGGPHEKLPDGIRNYYVERKITHPASGSDIRIYDKHLADVLDSTKIDGLMQDEQYIAHRKEEVRSWLKVKDSYECLDYSDPNTCIINFRGGEYARHGDFFLNKNYWDNSVAHMKARNQSMRFVVITDDVLTAKKFFPEYDVFHFTIGKDYSIIKNACNLILSNSSFAWFPAWLSEKLQYCIAPKHWGRHNISNGYWSLGYNITEGWNYMDRDGQLSDYDTCMKEWEAYQENHAALFAEPKINKNFLVVSNYNNDLRWVPEYTDNYLIYDRSEHAILPDTIDQSKVRRSPNVGYNSYDYFTFIIDHYDNLPDCTIFAKGWSFPRHVRKEYFDRVMNNECFTPMEDRKMHNPRFPISFFSPDGGYCEINNSWYLKHWKTKYFTNYNDFLRYMYKDPVIPLFTRFAPGGDYIVPKANILKLPKVVYENMRLFMSHCQEPGETHLIERAMYTLWMSNFELHPGALEKISEHFSIPPRSVMQKIKARMPVPIKNVFKSIINSGKNTIATIRKPYDMLVEKKRRQSWLSAVAAAEYRKTMRVYDAFNFFNELETLEIRLNILNDYVDCFVIVESTLTHSGLPKELYYEKNKHLFKQFEHKIIHYVIDNPLKSFEDARERLLHPDTDQMEKEIIQAALSSDNVQPGETSFLRDFYEKESVKKALVGLSDNDFCFVSDLDEIWNPDALVDYSKDDLYKFKQEPYIYYLNNRSNEDWAGWTGTIGTKYKNIRNACLNDLRTFKKNKYAIINNGGWHFSFQGGAERVKTKLESYSHQEINNDDIKSQIEARIEKNKDIRGRYIKFWKDESTLPQYLLNNKEKYKRLFR
ncbi:MAG: DUF3431 domain-containing protein [Patescibacteria group bacterium]